MAQTSNFFSTSKSKLNIFSSSPSLLLKPRNYVPFQAKILTRPIIINRMTRNPIGATLLAVFGSGLTLTIMGPATALDSLLQLSEPANALSLPTWAIHVSSVVERIAAMALVWEYGEKSEFKSWKGLSWATVPLLGGAFCACTWHLFYNSKSLEVLVALQAALTIIGNATMCIAAFRIYKSSEEKPKNP